MIHLNDYQRGLGRIRAHASSARFEFSAHSLEAHELLTATVGSVASKGTVARGFVASERHNVAMRPHHLQRAPIARSTFARFFYPPDVIVLAVRWYLRFSLSYRGIEELLAERGIERDRVDHTTPYLPVGGALHPAAGDAVRPARQGVGTCWQVDETYVKAAGQWTGWPQLKDRARQASCRASS
jgi:hypothetical protein